MPTGVPWLPVVRCPAGGSLGLPPIGVGAVLPFGQFDCGDAVMLRRFDGPQSRSPLICVDPHIQGFVVPARLFPLIEMASLRGEL